MLYRVLSNIVVQQIPSPEYPDRNMTIIIPFLKDYESEATWGNLTQKCKVVIPKNAYVKAISPNAPSMNGVVYIGNISGLNSNLGGFTIGQAPTLLRGDRITLNVGYRSNPDGKEQTYMTGTDLSMTGGIKIPDLFKGFISQVNPKLPFTVDCEDNMWLLKQIPTPSKQWSKLSIQDIVTQIISDSMNTPLIQRYEKYGGVNLTVSNFSKTEVTFNVYNFITQGGSLAALLNRIKHQYKLDSYFRGDELRIGLLHYVPADMVNHTFTFQRNIISDKLVWRRRDDVRLSMLVNSHYSETRDTTNADGTAKTVRKSTQILVYYDTAKEDFSYVTKEKGIDLPVENAGVAGETHKLDINSDVSDPEKLFEIAKPMLQKFYYTGFKGEFTTFGIPYVKHGDTVTLVDTVLPERNGTYMVKKVTYFGGSETGIRQRIELDYLVNA